MAGDLTRPWSPSLGRPPRDLIVSSRPPQGPAAFRPPPGREGGGGGRFGGPIYHRPFPSRVLGALSLPLAALLVACAAPGAASAPRPAAEPASTPVAAAPPAATAATAP